MFLRNFITYCVYQESNYHLSNMKLDHILYSVEVAERQLFIGTVDQHFMEDVTTETDVHLPCTTRLLKLNTLPSGMMGFVTAGVSHLEHRSLRFSQLIERWFPSCHLYDGAAQRPNVRWLAVSPRTLVYDFRSHVL